MDIYEQDDYKNALRVAMAERRQRFGSRYTFERMAEACGVQKTYLSKVLNSSAHLNPDQLFSAAEYLKLEPFQYEFLVLLREIQVTNHQKRIAILQEQINKKRKENLKTESVIETDPNQLPENFQWEYYSNIDLQLVHIFMTVLEYAKNPELIGEKIGVDKTELQNIILKLERWKLIQYDGHKYKTSDPRQHLSQGSPAFITFAILMRLKIMEKVRMDKKEGDYFFSALFSANMKFQDKLKKKILNLIKETQTEVIKSKSEQVYQLNIDFFKWS